MDVFDALLQAGWTYPLKLLVARNAVKRWKATLRQSTPLEEPCPDQREGWDSVSICATAPDGTALTLTVRKLFAKQLLAEINVHVKLPDGTTYSLPQYPEAAVGAWESIPDGWSAHGLKFQVLEPNLRLRILFNGLLTRVHDSVTQHVKLNLIWVSATGVVRHPEDWSNELAAQALACEPWRNGKWSQMLGNRNDGGWLTFGSIQGRFVAYDDEGAVDKSVYLQTRGVRERSWAPKGYQGVRRSVNLSVATSDGMVVQLKCILYKNGLTQVISGSVRLPNFSVESISSTDLVMSDFCETADRIPKAYTIHVSTNTRDLKLILRFNADEGRHSSGFPYQQEVVLRTLAANIDGFSGAGTLELGYETSGFVGVVEPTLISQPRLLKLLTKKEAGTVPHCLPFEERAAACPDYVGGKGASLALLASMQQEEGYRVPPGFCLTTSALEQHLEQNPELKDAVKEIEAASEHYEESYFKAKCEMAYALFISTDITGDVKSELLASIADLRRKATKENLGPELRFAVRSSAVGEDGEALSAAGQNDTVLGCESDGDVLKGVQQCWGSMFAFTSAYYRRQNGQPCLCGGGVVVQALVVARVAGVMFTRHPDAGAPSRLLVTANYGLGESVVSGAVEPDTFIVKRSGPTLETLAISKAILGTKSQRVTVAGEGVSMEDVPERERGCACLTDGEVLRLARLGVVQERLWGAGRDIEWAFAGNEIFLLQARPITSLERWTEEELLHELDCPIMADDELITFGNTGEVFPRPMTPMTHDFVSVSLRKGFDAVIGKDEASFDHSVVTTHNRCTLALYNSVYRQVPKEVNLNIRMFEMAVHGHPVADDSIMSTALHRNPSKWYQRLEMITLLIKSILISKRRMEDSIKGANAMTIAEGVEDEPLELWKGIADTEQMMTRFTYNHSMTTTASAASQFIAMDVLLEGRQDLQEWKWTAVENVGMGRGNREDDRADDRAGVGADVSRWMPPSLNREFSSELCSEIGALLSSGDVLSAEVPHYLDKLARMLEASGHYDQFRAQDPKDCMQWLKRCLPHIYLEVCRFLEQHGHRAIMEFDLYTKPWVLVPEDMMKVLQNIKASNEQTKVVKTDDEIIASLKSPQKSSTRKILKWVMPLCRRTVGYREGTKAQLILAVHKIRLAFLRLGKLMVKQWYLPNQDLIFFFRFHELRTYLETRDPGLLRKAMQRQQYHPGWCKLKFAEMNKGWVAPLETQGPMVTAGDVKIEAATVCGGEVVARACVVTDLSEINQLQQGDILITHATDIGWSPYFSLLTGIVTELGGLISHGAVIAREYGLPCIVGASGATDLFKTGDLVRLSGTKGTLERVQVTEKPELNGTNTESVL